MTAQDFSMAPQKNDKYEVSIPLNQAEPAADGAYNDTSDVSFLSSKDSDIESVTSEDNGRHSWNRKTEYLLSAIGYSVGLGNVYRFPYVCIRNGGGAFLVPFFICLMVCGLPLYFLEVSMGQFIAKSSFHTFDLCPLLKGAGAAMNVLCVIASWYYAIILGWTCVYLVNSFRDPLPWTLCGQWWNTESCAVSSTVLANKTGLDLDVNGTSLTNSSSYGLVYNVTGSANVTTASEEFWLHNVLELPDEFGHLTELPWHTAIGLLVALTLVLLGIIKGVKSVGKVVYVTATLPYILIGILLVKGATLPGAIDGVLFYIKPDFSKILTLRTWLEACLQVFFSLGPGWGGIHTMASYNKFKNNCLGDAVFLTLLCEGSSVFAGFAIFTVLGHMSHTLNVPVANFSRTGAGLAFVVYPEAISYLPLPQVWAVLFFVMLLTVGLDTMFVNVETVLTTVADVWPKMMSKRGVLIKCICMATLFLASLPFASRGGMYLFQLVDWYVGIFTVILVCFAECIIVSYIYGCRRFYRDLKMMLGHSPPCIFKLLWGVITPGVLLSIFVASLLTYTPPVLNNYEYTSGLQALGWLIGMVSFVPVPAWAIYKIATTEGTLCQRIKKNLKPSVNWRPSDPSLRESYLLETKHEGSIELPCCCTNTS